MRTASLQNLRYLTKYVDFYNKNEILGCQNESENNDKKN